MGNRDFKLHLPNSQSENALKQLKTLTSPLTKFAANIGASLDPRKYGSKVLVITIFALFHSTLPIHKRSCYSIDIFQTSVNDAPSDMEKEKLQEKWEATKCKTKLIAL